MGWKHFSNVTVQIYSYLSFFEQRPVCALFEKRKYFVEQQELVDPVLRASLITMAVATPVVYRRLGSSKCV